MKEQCFGKTFNVFETEHQKQQGIQVTLVHRIN
jgi:hypothetical protein